MNEKFPPVSYRVRSGVDGEEFIIGLTEQDASARLKSIISLCKRGYVRIVEAARDPNKKISPIRRVSKMEDTAGAYIKLLEELSRERHS